MDANSAAWWLKLKLSRNKKAEKGKIIDESNRREREFMHTPTYRRLLEREYEIDKKQSQKMKNERLEKMKNFNYEHTQLKPGTLGDYNPNNNTISFSNIPNSYIESVLSHERSHGLEDFNSNGEAVPGEGFRKKLIDIYKNKGLYDEDLEIGNSGKEYLYSKTERDETKHIERKLPTIGQYGEGSAKPYEYYVTTPTGIVDIGGKENLHNWFDENYPGLFQDKENWVKELRVLRLGARHGRMIADNKNIYRQQARNQMIRDGVSLKDKDYFFNLQHQSSDKRRDEYNKYYDENEFLFPISYANKDNYDYWGDIRTPNPDYNPYARSVNQVLPSSYSSKGYNINKSKMIDSELGPDRDFYYYSPTEVKARLKAVRDHAVKNGFRIGKDIRPYLQNIQDAGVREQYLDLQQKTGLSDEEINELMNYFAQNKENGLINSYNNIV